MQFVKSQGWAMAPLGPYYMPLPLALMKLAIQSAVGKVCP